MEDFNLCNSNWFERLCELAEKESIYDVNALVGAVSNSSVDLDKLTYAVKYTGVEDSAALISIAENLSLFTVIEGVEDYDSVGRYFADNSPGYAVPPFLKNFIDYENLGRQIEEEHAGKFVDGAFICLEEGCSLDEIISAENQDCMNRQNDENENRDESFGMQVM